MCIKMVSRFENFKSQATHSQIFLIIKEGQTINNYDFKMVGKVGTALLLHDMSRWSL